MQLITENLLTHCLPLTMPVRFKKFAENYTTYKRKSQNNQKKRLIDYLNSSLVTSGLSFLKRKWKTVSIAFLLG